MGHRIHALVARAILVALTTLLLVPASPALAAGEQDFVGKSVIVMVNVATSASSSDVVEDLTGKVKSATAVGIVLAAESRSLVTGSRRTRADYKADLFVPWSSILYLKLVPAGAK